MKKVKEFFSRKMFRLTSIMAVLMMVLVIGASAEDAPAASTSQVTSALTSALSSTANDVMSTITTLLPVALGVVGAFIAVKLGIKFFKQVTGR